MNELEKFAKSNQSVQASQLVLAVEQAIQQIHSQWETSPSDNADGREALFREIRGIRAGMLKVIRNLEG